MIVIYVIASQEDQAAFSRGAPVENILRRDFCTESHVEDYRNGVGAMADLVEYNIEEADEKSVLISFDDEPAERLNFASWMHRTHYCEGLDDADGFASVLLIEKGTEHEERELFERAEALYRQQEEQAAARSAALASSGTVLSAAPQTAG